MQLSKTLIAAAGNAGSVPSFIVEVDDNINVINLNIRSIAVDHDENIIAVGYYALDQSGTTLRPVYVIKIDPEGNKLWEKQITAGQDLNPIPRRGVAVDSNNDIFITCNYGNNGQQLFRLSSSGASLGNALQLPNNESDPRGIVIDSNDVIGGVGYRSTSYSLLQKMNNDFSGYVARERGGTYVPDGGLNWVAPNVIQRVGQSQAVSPNNCTILNYDFSTQTQTFSDYVNSTSGVDKPIYTSMGIWTTNGYTITFNQKDYSRQANVVVRYNTSTLTPVSLWAIGHSSYTFRKACDGDGWDVSGTAPFVFAQQWNNTATGKNFPIIGKHISNIDEAIGIINTSGTDCDITSLRVVGDFIYAAVNLYSSSRGFAVLKIPVDDLSSLVGVWGPITITTESLYRSSGSILSTGGPYVTASTSAPSSTSVTPNVTTPSGFNYTTTDVG